MEVFNEIVIPSAFTPNNDGSNDVWEISNLDNQFPNNIVYVYSRWGNLLYTSVKGKYAQFPWKGEVDGEILPVGSYYYIVEPNDGKTVGFKGTVSIILK